MRRRTTALVLVAVVLAACGRPADTVAKVEGPLYEVCRQLEQVEFLLLWIRLDTISELERTGGLSIDPAVLLQEMSASRLSDDLSPYLVLRLEDAGYKGIADQVTHVTVLMINLQDFSFKLRSSPYEKRLEAAQATVDEIDEVVRDAMTAILKEDKDAPCPPGAAGT